MTLKLEEWGDRISQPAVIADLESILKAKVSPRHIERLRHAVNVFQFLAMAEATPGQFPGRAERRRTMRQLARQCTALEKTLSSMTIQYFYRAFIDRLPKADELQELATEATELANDVPPTGADPKRARNRLVRTLADIFFDVTGKLPKGPVNWDNSQDEGRFLEFCTKVIANVDPAELDPLARRSALKGLPSEVRAIINDRKAAGISQ